MKVGHQKVSIAKYLKNLAFTYSAPTWLINYLMIFFLSKPNFY